MFEGWQSSLRIYPDFLFEGSFKKHKTSDSKNKISNLFKRNAKSEYFTEGNDIKEKSSALLLNESAIKEKINTLPNKWIIRSHAVRFFKKKSLEQCVVLDLNDSTEEYRKQHNKCNRNPILKNPLVKIKNTIKNISIIPINAGIPSISNEINIPLDDNKSEKIEINLENRKHFEDINEIAPTRFDSCNTNKFVLSNSSNHNSINNDSHFTSENSPNNEQVSDIVPFPPSIVLSASVPTSSSVIYKVVHKFSTSIHISLDHTEWLRKLDLEKQHLIGIKQVRRNRCISSSNRRPCNKKICEYITQPEPNDCKSPISNNTKCSSNCPMEPESSCRCLGLAARDESLHEKNIKMSTMSRRAVTVSSRSLANSAQNTPAASRCASKPDLTNQTLSLDQLRRVQQLLESHAAAQPQHSHSVDNIQNSSINPVVINVQSANERTDNISANEGTDNISANRHSTNVQSANERTDNISANRHSTNSYLPTNENTSNVLTRKQLLNRNMTDTELHNQSDNINTNVQNRNLLTPHNHNHWWSAESIMTSSASSPDTEPTTDSGEHWDVSSPTTDMSTNHSHREYRCDTNILLYRMPICGYEIVEHSTRFTVFKIQVVHQATSEHWFVFRRFTDFVRLNKKLRSGFPGLRFSLPPKRWMGDNFNPVFLENRQSGLQAFIDNVTGHAGVREAKSLRDFFCLDDPPEPYDSLEECRAVCGSLEDACRVLQERVHDRDGQISVLKSQVSFLTSQQALLVKALRLECELNERGDRYENSETSEMAESERSTHQLNLALLKLCETSLHRGLPNANHLSALTRSGSWSEGSNSVKSPTDGSYVKSPVSHLNVPVTRALEKVILKRCASQAAMNSTLRPLPQPLDAVVSAPVSQRTSIIDIQE